ncbi:hypothetical protein BOTBODRAFT_361613 [Botryobasidium botryosum FD-172 SS1]|uniref:Uncharacterized protein n=1 Tax=Botryobasidium botryosum (strain FD-172 SS1) TaxID=930990 RepID=A0A067MGM5_BOTB1|nr:hypothetical protein BOTBODRAFT_361613 [Botryobasidium botryosum FD-172 SS1]
MYRVVQGKTYILEDDELLTEEDPKGNTKIDKRGNLLGGRQFKAATFCSPWRPDPDKRYMLSIDAARTSGFRDSLYYFRRNLTLLKLTLSQAEKEHLIELGRLSTNLKSRSVTMLTARSAFKAHGAKMLKEGRWVVDDYYEDRVRDEILAKGLTPGDLVGELPDPHPTAPADTTAPTDSKHHHHHTNYAAASASAIYKPGGPTTHFGGDGLGPFQGELAQTRRAMFVREGVGEENWMWMAAVAVREANSGIQRVRRERMGRVPEPGVLDDARIEETVGAAASASAGTGAGTGAGLSGSVPPGSAPFGQVGFARGASGLSRATSELGDEGGPTREGSASRVHAGGDADEDPRPWGVYEPHTGLIHYRMDTQPTRSRLERVERAESNKRPVLGGTAVGSGAWGIAFVDTVMELDTASDSVPPPSTLVS